MAEFRMPSLGADMEAGTLVEWLVRPGDKVSRGDIVAVVETQKGAIEIEVFESGAVEAILVPLNAKVPVGTPLARIRGDTEGEIPASTPRPCAPRQPAPAQLERAPAVILPPTAVEAKRASPAARHLAKTRGIDLSAIRGSGPGGAVVIADVERTIGASSPEKRAIGIDLDAMRAAIAAAMARSKREIPHYYLEHQVDVIPCEDWLARTNERRAPGERIVLAALAIKSAALAAQRFPAFNGFYRSGGYEPSPAVHAGVAIAIRGGGLAAPAIRDADALSLGETMARLRDLVQRTRAGRLRLRRSAIPRLPSQALGIGEWGRFMA